MFISIGGTRIYYTKQGKGAPLIFLHGTFLDSSAYKELFGILSEKFTVYALDLPKHGKSDALKGKASFSRYVEVVEKFVSALKIRNPVIFGYSAGGLIALIYASRNKTKELILGDPAGAKYSRSVLPIVLRLIFIMVPAGFFSNPAGSLKIAGNGLYNFFRNFFSSSFFELSGDALGKDYSSDMKKIRCKTVLLWSRRDEITPFSYSRFFLDNIKGSRLVEVRGNHQWPALKPEEIKKAFRFI